MFSYEIEPDQVIRVILLLVIGLPLLGLLRTYIHKFITDKYSAHYAMLIAKTFFYVGFAILFVMILHELGFRLGPLLGAAGILGVAIGFASQTSVSNIISGFFLIGEKAFVVGDIITINNTTGVVLSIDTMSVKMRAFDNHMVRIPNEMMLKSQVTNITRYPIRRASIKLSVAYKEDLENVRKVIIDVVDKNMFALQEPACMIHFDSFASSSIDMNLRAWCQKEHFIDMVTSLNFEIKRRFDEEGIEIPYPHLSLYTGEKTRAFPISSGKDDTPEMFKTDEKKE